MWEREHESQSESQVHNVRTNGSNHNHNRCTDDLKSRLDLRLLDLVHVFAVRDASWVMVLGCAAISGGLAEVCPTMSLSCKHRKLF
jgi:hypothetical protein